MIQIICTLVLFLLILFPVGNYIYHISAGKKTWADPLFDRVDNCLLYTSIYHLSAADRSQEAKSVYYTYGTIYVLDVLYSVYVKKYGDSQ